MMGILGTETGLYSREVVKFARKLSNVVAFIVPVKIIKCTSIVNLIFDSKFA